MILGFFIGLSIGLLLHRQGHKPILQFPLRCWFLGHVPNKQEGACDRCRLYGIEDARDRFTSTFWTV